MPPLDFFSNFNNDERMSKFLMVKFLIEVLELVRERSFFL